MNSQHAIRTAVICSAMLALPSFVDADVSDSRTSPAIAGHAWQSADASCFSSSWSAVHNSCTTTRKFLVPVHIRYGGLPESTVSLAVAAENNSSKTARPTCRGIMNDFGNGLIAQTAAIAIARGPAYTNLGALPVGGSGFSGDGQAHLDCDLAPSSASGLGLTAVKWVTQ
jgi:hypothetical protein